MRLIFGREEIPLNKGTAKQILPIFLIIATLFAASVVFSASEEETTGSTATISKAVAITRSTNMSTDGIPFGTVSPNTLNNNASGNANHTNHSQYWITIDSSTNTNIILCIKEDADLGLADGSANISNTNYHYIMNTTTLNSTEDIVSPGPAPATTDITTSYVNISSFDPGYAMNSTNNTLYIRFHLDVDSGQAGGSYSNNVFFKGVDLSETC